MPMLSTEKVLDLIKTFECRNITYIAPDNSWPIVWYKAKGYHVWDIEGRKYIDMSAAFGVVATGHSNRKVLQALIKQARLLIHAMGDVHPHPLKGKLAQRLSNITFERWSNGNIKGKCIFCNSGFEAIEASLKTAFLATGKERVIAFEGAYHGLGYGTLNTTYRPYFRSPFRRQLTEFGDFVQFPQSVEQLPPLWDHIERLLKRNNVGAILVEPIQGRGGIRVPPDGFLKGLRQLCDCYKVLLIFDEIFTGFGRTGYWFACEHERVIPDIICLGKALTGGFPLSVCIGKAELMDRAWPPSEGEALHTTTFAAHPLGCAMALAQIAEIKRLRLIERVKFISKYLIDRLIPLINSWPYKAELRGRGLMLGISFYTNDGKPASSLVLQLVKRLLHEGFIVIPEGDYNEVLSITPPLTISKQALLQFTKALHKHILALT